MDREAPAATDPRYVTIRPPRMIFNAPALKGVPSEPGFT
jgi:hypothetical protein